MRVLYRKLILAGLLLASLGAMRAHAASVTVDAFALTISGYSYAAPNLNLPKMNRGQGMTLMPFYLRVNYTQGDNMNWGVELYSDNRTRLTPTASAIVTPDGLYRGLRGFVNPTEYMPLYWQSYPTDQQVATSWGMPNSITLTAGGLGFSQATLRFWGTIYDQSDIDRDPTQNPQTDPLWISERNDRVVASAAGLGKYPYAGRPSQGTFAYLYFATDLRNVGQSQDYVGQLILDFFHYPFDFNTGCYVTPNPVRPMLGQQAYFNFYTNDPNSKIVIKIYDPTGSPVVTLQNTRNWNCRNSNGTYVEGGLYIYQLQVEGHFISGTVVVIK